MSNLLYITASIRTTPILFRAGWASSWSMASPRALALLSPPVIWPQTTCRS